MSKLKYLAKTTSGFASLVPEEDSAETPFGKLIESGEFDYYFERGQIVTGRVASYVKDGVLIDVGAKSEAFVPAREVADYASDPAEVLPEEQDFEFYILRDEAGSGFDGRIVLSFKRVAQAKSWTALEDKRHSDELFEARIQDVVKGGVVVEIDGLRGFIPASHLRVKGGSNNPNLVGQKIPCTILEIDKQQNKLILSQKIAISKLYAEEREILLSELVQKIQDNEAAAGEGEKAEPVIVDGEVVRITDFGAFVKIGDTEIDGLLPLSEIAWKRVTHPSEALKIGDQVKVMVLNVVPEQCRISLSLKRLQTDPWDLIQQRINVGDVINGSVNKVTDFGVFIKIDFDDTELNDCGFEALLPSNELSGINEDNSNSDDLLEEFQINQKLKALVKTIKTDERRVTLSTKHIDKDGKIIIPLEDNEEVAEDNA
ncbi:MAG TPA: S1 RNA-binding domain-containing protein [Vampirovibrionales bacterium]